MGIGAGGASRTPAAGRRARAACSGCRTAGASAARRTCTTRAQAGSSCRRDQLLVGYCNGSLQAPRGTSVVYLAHPCLPHSKASHLPVRSMVSHSCVLYRACRQPSCTAASRRSSCTPCAAWHSRPGERAELVGERSGGTLSSQTCCSSRKWARKGPGLARRARHACEAHRWGTCRAWRSWGRAASCTWPARGLPRWMRAPCRRAQAARGHRRG